jgi:hypothetical protein
MTYRHFLPTILSMMLLFVSCNSQETAQEQPATLGQEAVNKQPHGYGGWYCPDNFGFVPVDVQKLSEVPAIAHRLPTAQELTDHKALIKVDTALYPDARALKMDLPRVASIYSEHKGMSELIIVIQAVVVQEDTVVGYRFMNGGNGSARLSEVSFLSDDAVAKMGSQPFYYSKAVLHATPERIWNALITTDYFQQLGVKFDRKAFFSAAWDPNARTEMHLDTRSEKATGHVGVVYGNFYLQIDYLRDGVHYSEKMLLIENMEDHTTELHVASGPFPKDFARQKLKWDNWVEAVAKASEAR